MSRTWNGWEFFCRAAPCGTCRLWKHVWSSISSTLLGYITYSLWFKLDGMEIGENPYKQAATKATYVVFSCARSKSEEIKKLMREYFPGNVQFQDLCGRWLAGSHWIDTFLRKDERLITHTRIISRIGTDTQFSTIWIHIHYSDWEVQWRRLQYETHFPVGGTLRHLGIFQIS